jgi:hypothetical protein
MHAIVPETHVSEASLTQQSAAVREDDSLLFPGVRVVNDVSIGTDVLGTLLKHVYVARDGTTPNAAPTSGCVEGIPTKDLGAFAKSVLSCDYVTERGKMKALTSHSVNNFYKDDNRRPSHVTHFTKWYGRAVKDDGTCETASRQHWSVVTGGRLLRTDDDYATCALALMDLSPGFLSGEFQDLLAMPNIPRREKSQQIASLMKQRVKDFIVVYRSDRSRAQLIEQAQQRATVASRHIVPRKSTIEIIEEETAKIAVLAEHYKNEINDAGEPVLPDELVDEFKMLHLLCNDKLCTAVQKQARTKLINHAWLPSKDTYAAILKRTTRDNPTQIDGVPNIVPRIRPLPDSEEDEAALEDDDELRPLHRSNMSKRQLTALDDISNVER